MRSFKYDSRSDEIFHNPTPKQCETVIHHPNGSGIPVYLEILPLFIIPDNPYALIACAPLQEDKEPEDTLYHIDENLNNANDTMVRMLLDLNSSATALIDVNAKVVFANEGFSEITGLSQVDLVGTDVRDLGIFIPDSTLTPGATTVEYLPGIIKIQSEWGIQEYSGVVVPLGSIEKEIVAILVLQPIEKLSVDTTIPIKTPDLQSLDIQDDNNLPIPHMILDVSGKIIRVNNAFAALTGINKKNLEGMLRNDLIKSNSDGIMRMVLPSKMLRIREIRDTVSDDNGNTGYWYFDLSDEDILFSKLNSRIQTLENEISTLMSREQSTSSVHDETSIDLTDIVEFELNHERYAMDITMVREVVEMLPITPIPRTQPYVVGIINLRGEVTHIIDLSVLLGERPKKERSGQKIIIIPSDVTRGEHVGIIVDNVQSVTEIRGKHVSSLSENIATQIQTHIKGIIKISHDDALEKHNAIKKDASLVIWLDIQKIFLEIQGKI